MSLSDRKAIYICIFTLQKILQSPDTHIIHNIQSNELEIQENYNKTY